VEIDDLLSELVESLDRDLELLFTLRYRLVVLGALATADQAPSIVTAVREIEIAYEALRLEELVRSAATVMVLDHFELDPAVRLDELAEHVGGAWAEMLCDRRKTLIETVTGIQSLANTVSAVMGRRAALADEALAFLRADGGVTYGRSSSRGGVLVDGAL
jgi:hypothetical protein